MMVLSYPYTRETLKFLLKKFLVPFSMIILGLFISHISNGQIGDHLLSHHTLNVSGLDNTNYEMVVDNNGLLSIANRSGVLQYHGHVWDYYATPSAAVSIALDSTATVFVGCVSDYGYIGYDRNRYQYISLKDSSQQESIYFSTEIINRSVYFLSEDQLIRYHIENKELTHFSLPDSTDYFVDIFSVDNVPIIQSGSGFFGIDGSVLSPLDLSIPDSTEILFFIQRPEKGEYIVGTSDNSIYDFRNNGFEPSGIDPIISENNLFINDAVWINSDHLAISTIESGCFIFDYTNDSLLEIIDYHKGLPDNEIFAITTDNENGLWLSHEFGLTRVENNIPIKSFSNFPGMDGNLTSAIKFDDKLYVASSHGLFYLDSEHEYMNSVYYTLRNSPRAKPTPKKKPEEAEKKVKRKPFFGLTRRNKEEPTQNTGTTKNTIFGKKRNTEADSEQSSQNKKFTFRKAKKNTNKSSAPGRTGFKFRTPEKINGLIRNIIGKPANSRKYVRHVKREIIDTKYVYRSMEGLSSKSRQFIVFEEQLLVSGISGVYEVNNSSVTQIIQQPIRYAHFDQFGKRLIVSTYNNSVQIYEHLNDLWVETDEVDFYGEVIVSILSDDKGNIWLASPNNLYKLDTSESDDAEIPEFNISNQYIDNVRLSIIDDQVYVINSLGYYYFDEGSARVVPDSSLYKVIGKPVRHLQQTDGSIWVYNGKSWQHINKNKEVNSYQHLGLFPDMTFIDEFDDKLWIINDNESLYQFDPQVNDSLISNNKMFYKDIRNKVGQVNRSGDLKLSYNDNSLEFELSRPDYLGLLNVEYQYKLEGLTEEWTSWSHNNKLDFNYLPPNKYVLKVRSRDSFGHIQESYPFQFVINPPYWHTLWFYAIQIIFMATLVYVSIQLNKRAKTKYVILTEGLTILTIVFIIEFLQTVAESYLGLETSPVVDFMIDFGIAIMILPFEHILKKLMKVEEIGPGISGKGILDFLPLKRQR